MLLEVTVIGTLATIAIIIGLVVGFIVGLMAPFSDKTVKAIGVILAVFAAHYIKNPVSVFLYKHLPFFDFFGPVKGVTSLNILLYEFLAFIIVLILILIVLRILMIFTKVIDKLVGFVLGIGIPTNFITGILYFCITYIILFVIAYFGFTITALAGYPRGDRTFADSFIETPVLKSTLGQPLGSLLEIANLSIDYNVSTRTDEFNSKALEVLLKNDIISTKNAKSLLESGKMDIKDSGKLIAKYEKK